MPATWRLSPAFCRTPITTSDASCASSRRPASSTTRCSSSSPTTAPAPKAGPRVRSTTFAYTFDGPDEPERHHIQYYEMFGCRALYDRGWKAVTYHDIQAEKPGLDKAAWELYHVAEDPSECHDLAAEERTRLDELVAR